MPDDQKMKISATLMKYNEVNPREVVVRHPKAEKTKTDRSATVSVRCDDCHSHFKVSWKSSAKYCHPCRMQRHSANRAKYLQEHGTTNFAIRVAGFTYKNITIDCDSRLETAAVVYLVDVVGATSIERVRSILTYKDDDGMTRRYNPDFYVRVGGDRLVVEVKQTPARSSRQNSYNRFFPQKKKALEDFATARGMRYMWLDFEYDKRFKTLYQRMIKIPQ